MSAQVILKPDWARITFPSTEPNGESEYADFHYFWLRHNCPCLYGCRHTVTKERLIDAAVIPLEIRPLRASVESNPEDNAPAVVFVWEPILTKDDTGKLVSSAGEKEHVSIFPVQWLRENAYSLSRRRVHELPPHDAALVTIDYNDYAPEDGSLSDSNSIKYKAMLFEKLSKYGVAVIRNRGDNTEDIVYDFIDSSADVIPTHFGRIEHLRTGNTENANNDQLGYTNSAVRLHTDLCYSESVPGFQFLHCIRPADIGGDNYFVHAESAANYLKTEINSRAYELLTTVPVKFDRKQSKFQAHYTTPILRLSDKVDPKTNERRLEQVRYSYFTQGAQTTVPFSQLREWYEAQQ
ncbi:hypothetical protein GGI22_006790, partial [Coemansia erecta]